MTVLTVNRIGAPTAGKRQGEVDETFKRVYREQYRVITSDPRDGLVTVLSAGGLPVIGNPYLLDTGEGDIYALCKRLRGQEQENPCYWIVEAEFNSDLLNPAQQNINPLDEFPDIQWGGEKILVATNTDLDDQLIESSAGELFDPPYAFEYPGETVTITRNEPSFNRDLRKALLYTVCSYPFGGYDVGQALLVDWTAKELFRNGIDYFANTYTIKFDDVNGFETLTLIDRGTMKIDGAGKQVVILDKNANPVSTPVLLDGSGGVLTPPTMPHFVVDFRIRDQADWTPLNLDSLVL